MSKSGRSVVIPEIPNHTDLEFVGGGGMGTVFRGRQQPMNRVVAIKIMHPLLISESTRERFVNEIRANAKVKHRGIATVYEVGECGVGPYFTMDYMAGGNLGDRLRQNKKIEPLVAARWIADAADAVHAAHQEGILHRDLKPSNILIDHQGNIKIGDFGLAKHMADQSQFTASGVHVGTPSYMSPEQAGFDTSQVSRSSDVYGLGATLFHLVTGQPPFRGANPQQTLAKLLRGPTPTIHSLDPNLCPILNAIVQKSMARDPRDRYQTAGEFASDLRRWIDGESTVARPLTRLQSVRRSLYKYRRAIAVLLFMGLLSVGAVVAVNEAQPKRQIERALARGEKVTLVGATGLPRWSQWDLSPAELDTNITGDKSAGFQTQLFSLLRLVEDPMTEHYRIKLDLRHCSRGPYSGSYVGLYFNFETGTTEAGKPYMRFFTLKFSDFWENIELMQKRARDTHSLRFQDIVLTQEDDRYGVSKSMPGLNVPEVFRFEAMDDPANANRWRTIIVDVHPEKLVFTWIPEDEASKQSTTVYPPQVEHLRNQSPKLFPNAPGGAAQPYWNPRRPLGILATSSSVTFRNVTIEPLPDPNP